MWQRRRPHGGLVACISPAFRVPALQACRCFLCIFCIFTSLCLASGLRAEPAPDGANPRALFKQVAAASLEAAARRVRQGQRYCRYYALAALDTLKNPCSLWAG